MRSTVLRFLGLLGASCLIFLVGAEGAVRLAAVATSRSGVILGSRGENDTIVCLGDSFTFGQGVRPEESWPRLLAQSLHTRLGDKSPAVEVVAEPGRSSSQTLVDLATTLKRPEVSTALILSGWNANDGDFAEDARRRAVPLSWQAKLELLLENFRLYKVIKQAFTLQDRIKVFDGVPVVPQTTSMSLYDFRAYQRVALANLQKMAELCKVSGKQCLFLMYPHREMPDNPISKSEYYHMVFGKDPISEADYLVPNRTNGDNAINSIIRLVATQEDLPLLDLQLEFLEGESRGLYLSDLHHPSPGGHSVIAVRVEKALLKEP